MRDQVQLIAYADRLGGSLPGLAGLLRGPLAGMFGGVHVLPFYLPYDGADAGFDPEDHLTVDPRLGTWDDLRALAADRDVVADLIVNHASDRSAAFRDVVERGDASPHAAMFLTYDRVFPPAPPRPSCSTSSAPGRACPSPRSARVAGSGWPGPRSPDTRSTWTYATPPPGCTCRPCSGGWRTPASPWSVSTPSVTR